LLGRSTNQTDVFNDSESFCAAKLKDDSIYSFLRREREHLFPDDSFADLYDEYGRRGVPPSVVAVVMVLQRLQGLSDREAVERYMFDARWRYACGVSGYGEWPSFAHTVLVDMRERLRLSERPDRILDGALGAAKEAGLLGRRRVLDSTPLYNAVATMDTVTLIRSAMQGLLHAAGAGLEGELREAICSGDDYASSAKPQIDWENKAAREALIDSRAKDGYACLLLLDGRVIDPDVVQAARLLAAVLAQDLEETPDGVLRIKRGVAHNRLLSTVDPDARHGHKTESHGFDGYKGHVAIDPESELISAATVTAGNAADSTVAGELIADLVAEHTDTEESERESSSRKDGEDDPDETPGGNGSPSTGEVVYGDTHYGTGEFQACLEAAGIASRCKAQNLVSVNGLYSKAHFVIELEGQTVTCPNGVTVGIRSLADGSGTASFARQCRDCLLAQHCTRSVNGRTVTINRFEGVLARARARQADDEWRADYRATRPKIERKIAHLMRRKHGGRRARVRGLPKVAADFKLLVAAVDCARLATLGLRWTGDEWTVEAVRTSAGFEATAIIPSHRVGISSGVCAARHSVYRPIAANRGKNRPCASRCNYLVTSHQPPNEAAPLTA
jgi:Transposase DDE domain/Transposase domain (DUF772)